MKAEGRLREATDGGVEVQGPDGKWTHISKTDMGHIEDVVTWWNREGFQHGKKTPPVRQWMRNADNYELENSSVNRSKGAKLRQTYRDPAPQPSPAAPAPAPAPRDKL